MPSLTPRRLTPELLDILAADDRSAIESRRDLARLNWFMRNDAIIARHLKVLSGDRPPRTILDLGGGDGTFALRIARRLSRVWPKMSVTLLDRQHIVSEATKEGFAALGWYFKVIEANVFDVMTALVPETYDVVVTNLFLHHFDDDQIRQLLAEVRHKTKLFVATEPQRGAWGLTATRMVGALGCNSVTRHDARVSVEAGFAADELTQAWTCRDAWKLEERRVGPFTHIFYASRVTDDAL